MALHRLRENWRHLKGLMLDRWRGPLGAERDTRAPERRRQELVEHIQQLAREETRDGPTHLRR